MTISTADDVHYDPWDVDLNADPYPMFRAYTRERAAVLQRGARLLRTEPVR